METVEKVYAPIIIFSYNRLDHLKATLQALEQADDASYSEVYIYADGYKGEEDRENVLAVHYFLKEYEKKHSYRKLAVIYREHNLGLEQSVITGVSEVLEKYQRIIVLEDDLIVSKDFIRFMNKALEYYEFNDKIWQISAWSEPVPELGRLKHDTYLWYRCNSWGWAIWRNRWQKIDWQVKDYTKFRFSMIKRRRFKRGGADMADMLDMQMQGKIHSWAIRFGYAEYKNNMLTVFPKITKVRNIGHDGSGTNCHKESETAILELKQGDIYESGKYSFGNEVLNKRLSHLLYRSYSGSCLHCLKWSIKSLLNRLGIQQF